MSSKKQGNELLPQVFQELGAGVGVWDGGGPGRGPQCVDPAVLALGSSPEKGVNSLTH